MLFLDNFEQVLSAAPAVASLLGAAPAVKIAVTSRAPLRIAGEHELPVPPLSLDPAVELFLGRACEHNPRFSPDDDGLRSISDICQRVDGLPLAIELAAARVRMLDPGEILERISRRLDFLSHGRRDAPERHRTLRATIVWSHELLNPGEQRLFEQLAVFQSGWSLEAAEAVAGGDVLDPLTGLIEHSLVIREGSRFRMLETVREYALERLGASPEETEVRRAHARWCVSLAGAAERKLDGPEQGTWLARLDAEAGNLRAAAAWALASAEPEVALALDAALWRYWLARGAAMQVRTVLDAALDMGSGDRELRAKALNAAGVLAGSLDDFDAARTRFGEALELAEEMGERRQMARALANLAVIETFESDYEAAIAHYQAAAPIWRELGDARGEAVALQNLALVHEMMGEYDEAMPLLERSIELAQAAGGGMQFARTLMGLARLLIVSGADDHRVPKLLGEGLERCSALGERVQTIEGLEVVAAFAAQRGANEFGAALMGAADAERAHIASERKPDERPFCEQTGRVLQQALGFNAYARAHERGRDGGLDAAVASAISALRD